PRGSSHCPFKGLRIYVQEWRPDQSGLLDFGGSGGTRHAALGRDAVLHRNLVGGRQAAFVGAAVIGTGTVRDHFLAAAARLLVEPVVPNRDRRGGFLSGRGR